PNSKNPKAQRPAIPPAIRLKEESAGAPVVFEVINLKQADLDRLTHSEFTQDQWKDVFAVYVEEKSQEKPTSRPPVIGAYRVENNALRFVPRFPLERGLHYRAVFNFAKLPDHQETEH